MKRVIYLFLFSLFLLSCKKEEVRPPNTYNMDKILIKQGNHYPTKLYTGFQFNDKVFNYAFVPTESMRYNLGNENQKDWNKLPGISFDITDKNSVRPGWRYDLETKMLEISVYVHKGGKRVPDERSIKILIRENDDEGKYRIDGGIGKNGNTYVRVQSSDMQPQVIESVPLTPNPGRYMGAMFGGNETAPHDIYFYLN